MSREDAVVEEEEATSAFISSRRSINWAFFPPTFSPLSRSMSLRVGTVRASRPSLAVLWSLEKDARETEVGKNPAVLDTLNRLSIIKRASRIEILAPENSEGSGGWFNPYIKILGTDVKYGVVGTRGFKGVDEAVFWPNSGK